VQSALKNTIPNADVFQQLLAAATLTIYYESLATILKVVKALVCEYDVRQAYAS
jgi:hypothetical protein